MDIRQKNVTPRVIGTDTDRPTTYDFLLVIRSNQPRAGSGVVRMDPLRFLAGCRTGD